MFGRSLINKHDRTIENKIDDLLNTLFINCNSIAKTLWAKTQLNFYYLRARLTLGISCENNQKRIMKFLPYQICFLSSD